MGKVIQGDEIIDPKILRNTNNEIPIIIAVDLNFPTFENN